MMKAIVAALSPTQSQKHVRIVCFMTDGYVGNEAQIIAEIQRYSNARVFSFGIGSSVNRYLLDKMAEVGRGEVEYVSLNDNGSAAAKRFHERVRNPLLTDISVDWNGLPVSDIYPKRINDLFSAKPVVIMGRYTGPAKGTIRLRAKLAGHPITREIAVDLPAAQPAHDVLATLWARTKIDDLTHSGVPDAEPQITKLGLDYKLMTAHTSFVAVEEMTITSGGQPRRVDVPVEMPEGVSYEGVFGEEIDAKEYRKARQFMPPGMASSVAGIPSAPPPPIPSVRRGAANLSDHAQPEREERAAKPESKIAPALTGAGRAKLLVNGKLDIHIWLLDASPAALEQLRKLGVEIVAQPKTGRVVLARVAPDKLLALAQLAAVRYIASAR